MNKEEIQLILDIFLKIEKIEFIYLILIPIFYLFLLIFSNLLVLLG